MQTCRAKTIRPRHALSAFILVQRSQTHIRGCAQSRLECAIAYWGIALSYLYNPHAPPPPENLALGLEAAKKGQALGAKTQRERDYIDAIAAMYTDYEKVDHRTRVQNYLKAEEQVALRYPKDDEAQIAYAITLNVAASPADKTYVNQLKGAALLEPIFKRQPQHPGVAHYLIHLYDYPAIADKGLEAAKRYSKIAAAAPHAQHMPSHIFTRVGYWKELIVSNMELARVAKLDGEQIDQAHAMDYMVYAYLQLAQDKKARAVVDELLKIDFKQDRFAGPYALAASQARYASAIATCVIAVVGVAPCQCFSPGENQTTSPGWISSI